MNKPLEELQKKLEEATQPEHSTRNNQPSQEAQPLDPQLAEWKQVWKALGQLLDSAEQALPEPAWQLPPETLAQPAQSLSRGKPHVLGGVSFRWVGVAALILGLLGGSLWMWWPRERKGANDGVVVSTQQQPAVQGGASGLPSSSQPSRPSASRNTLPQTGQQKVVPTALPGPASPDASPQETFTWEDTWEETILTISQASMAIQGESFFENDAFAGIRQKIAEIQSELDQTML